MDQTDLDLRFVMKLKKLSSCEDRSKTPATLLSRRCCLARLGTQTHEPGTGVPVDFSVQHTALKDRCAQTGPVAQRRALLSRASLPMARIYFPL